MKYIDIHTHNHTANPEVISIFCCDEEDVIVPYCSVGIHPWNTILASTDSSFVENRRKQILSSALMPDVKAIGEVGLDVLRGAEMDIQIEVFRQMIAISEQTKKPLIIHQVKSLEHIIRLHRECRPRQRWIIHGYRNKVEQARQLIHEGIELSFGQHFNTNALMLAWQEKALWLETDTAELTIEEIYRNAAVALGIDEEELKTYLYRKVIELLSLPGQE